MAGFDCCFRNRSYRESESLTSQAPPFLIPTENIMGFITLGIGTDDDVGPEYRSTSVGVRLYLWSCVLSSFFFLMRIYLGFAVAYPPPRGVVLGWWAVLAILCMGSLSIGLSKFRRETTTWVSYVMGIVLGAIVIAQAVFCLIGFLAVLFH